jgi:hypothetical protein
MDDNEPQRDGKGQFVIGYKGGPGRPKGSRNKLGEAFTQALLEDFEREGSVAIARTRDEDPAAYLRVIASVVPKEFKIEAEPLGELSDDDLERLIGLIRAAEGSADAAREHPGTPGVTH